LIGSAVPKISSQQHGLSGIFNVDKPAGMTSHDVVHLVRRASGQRRVGHAGTLDPMATGVLVVCLGWATRLVEYLVEGRKRYRATLRLGITTDTYDAEGTILAETGDINVTEAEVSAVLSQFLGTIQQVPPMFSAVKHEGKPLYKLARRGEWVPRPARDIHIERLDLGDWSPPHLSLDVLCSKGTYVRSLAHDIGQKLGCGAHLAALIRLASEPFRLDEAVALESLIEALARGRAQEMLYPLEQALDPFEVWVVNAESAQDILYGRAVVGPPPGGSSLLLALLGTGEPLAVLQFDTVRGMWQPAKVFNSTYGESS
jgi:tRNA pseudouridine55 synthase